MKYSLLIPCIILCCQKQPPIDFFKENIVIEIKDNGATVTGQYFFKNLTDQDKRVTFYYPFPVDSNHVYPDTIMLDFPYTKDTAGIYFDMPMKAQSICSLEISYYQKTRLNQFTYITTTTHQWKKPIKQALFKIIAPASLQVRFNYSPYTHKKVNDKNIFTVKKTDFFPENDLDIKWHVSP